MLEEQLAPLVGEQRRVRLDGVVQELVRRAVLVGQCQRPPEEVDAHQRGLATLPGDGHLGDVLRFDHLTDVLGQQVVGHAEPVAWIQRLLREEEAVAAVEVADRARGLGEDVQMVRRRERPRVRQGRERRRRGLLAQRDGYLGHPGIVRPRSGSDVIRSG